ncbi:zonadhesin [Manduca sexta]|uniref:zonadhesin n=1 Tax=Manduca sexta TaxID=7130 RepID=UPI00188E7623|nr:zonadhesin [Manduca sexta]
MMVVWFGVLTLVAAADADGVESFAIADATYCSTNETFATCKVDCPSVYCPVNDDRARVACAVAYPCPPGCICNANYRRLSPADDKCILASDCPPVKCKRPNEIWNSCPPNCLTERCDDIGRNQTSCPLPQYCDPQCVCKPGFYRNDRDICVPVAECRKCPANAIFKKCPSPCPATCDNPTGDRPCSRACEEYGCECKPGYVLFKGKCISLQKCPAAKSCQKNETFAACKVNCPTDFCPVNDNRASVACSVVYPCPPGCICKANHRRLSQADDKCILASDCPPVKCKRPNEIWNSCPPNCLADRCDDIDRNQTSCSLSQYCDPQCVCKPGFYRNDSDICVPAAECRKCPANAIFKKCPSPCPGTCDNPSGDRRCERACLEYGCECKPGYVLSNGKCILLKECPAAKLCKKNETFAACKAECPNSYCPENDIRAIIACDPPYPCRSGCICQANHRRLRSNNDRCILASDCPSLKCKRPNEEWNRCPSNCLAERCEDIYRNQTECNKSYSYCDPKCVCKQGFYRNSSDVCVPAAECAKKCSIKPECRPTCAVPNPPNCTYTQPSDTNIDGCQCQEGYILSKTDGECIKIELCPANLGCNGDPNAVVRQCPLPCPSTCDAPNATPCKRKCDNVGCECSSGFLLSKTSGKCIRPEECEGGNPCGQNEIFVQCKSDCDYDYCPKDDSLQPIACEYPPAVPCYSGCICNLNHKRKSREDQRCIVSSDCPPVNCTREHEVWNPCPSECSSGYCDSVDTADYPCNTLLLNCQPRCTCMKNYFRNASDVCISADECRKIYPQNDTTPSLQCGFNEVPSDCKIACPPQTCDSIFTSYDCPKNASCELGCNCLDEHLRNGSGICVPSNECFTQPSCPIPSECRRTCAVPNPPNCPENKPSATNVDGCQCKSGYVLSDTEGECIEVEKCPRNLSCNGDPHALITKCPWPCPSTCVAPNTIQCRKACLDVGCQCEPGYLLSKLNGKCILPEECPNGNPCGDNGYFSDCGFKCPNQYCPEDDSLVKYACKPGRPCPPGCRCKDNYKFRSYENESCVLARDCPRVNCTRPSEVWKSCPLIEYCRDIDSAVLCSDTSENDCQPRCVCIDGNYRDENDNCVPEEECKKQDSTRK